MNRFQKGSLFKLERKRHPDVWAFRWYENTSGKRIYKKKIIGSVTQLRNRREAEKAIVDQQLNAVADHHGSHHGDRNRSRNAVLPSLHHTTPFKVTGSEKIYPPLRTVLII